MKKCIAMVLALVMVLGLCACSVSNVETTKPAENQSNNPEDSASSGENKPDEAPVEISLWTFPLGNWGDPATVDALLEDFNAAYPNIHVTVEYLTYTDGDDKVNAAIEGHATPDMIFEGPERLVANWGARGKMVDLSDLWTEETKADIEANSKAVADACKWSDGAYYEYPLCMTTHTMAVNKRIFEETGAIQYLDTENHTWTTENFLKAVQTVYDAGYETVGAIYCSGQGGDQGTRALINNLYGGAFTNDEFTAYTVNSPENIKAMETLRNLDGMVYDPAINGGEAITLFRNGTAAMCFCWNVAMQLDDTTSKPGFTNDGDEILYMAFPSEDGTPELCGGIWGFGVFDNGDAAKIEASKTFIKYMCDENPTEAVKTSLNFPVKASVKDVYAGEDSELFMNEFSKVAPYMGGYYQIVPGWAEARTAWWQMLQNVGAGGDIAAAVENFDAISNAAAGA